MKRGKKLELMKIASQGRWKESASNEQKKAVSVQNGHYSSHLLLNPLFLASNKEML